MSDEQLGILEQKYKSMALWIPIEQGIRTFAALALRHELHGDAGMSAERDYYLAFEIACFHGALDEAAKQGEEGFHIQCY